MATKKTRKSAAAHLKALEKEAAAERELKRKQLRIKAYMGDRATRKKATAELGKMSKPKQWRE